MAEILDSRLRGNDSIEVHNLTQMVEALTFQKQIDIPPAMSTITYTDYNSSPI